MQKQPNYFIIAIIAAQIIFIALLAFSLPQLFASPRIDEGDRPANPSLEIAGLADKFPDFSEDELREIKIALLMIVGNNVSDIDLVSATATIRAGSVNSLNFEDEKLKFYNFIVDVPALEQSYQLFITSSTVEQNERLNPNEAFIPLCLVDESEKKYPDFDCKNIYSSVTRDSLLSRNITFLDFDNFYAESGESLKDIDLVLTCVDADENMEQKYLAELKTAIETLGVSPEAYTYHFNRSEATHSEGHKRCS